MRLQDLIIFEDENFVVVNKPSGLLSIPDREGKEISLKKILQEKPGNIFVVHRLDKDTSGLIVFAKNEIAHRYLSLQFENRQTEKIYLGLASGSLQDKIGIIDAPIAEHPAKKGIMIVFKKGKESQTDYEVLENFGIYSWIKFRIHSGRTHQIRVHCKHIGHPLACDELYGDGKSVFLSSIKPNFKLSKNEDEEKPLLNRLALHSFQFSFTNLSGEKILWEAPLSKDLKAVLQQLGKRKKVI